MFDRRPAVVIITLLILAPLLLACLWDRDTLKMELEEFPSALELITGKFRRHSDDYYRWRIEDRTKKLPGGLAAATAQHLPLLDDLAVAHDKLSEHDRAIAIADRTLEIAPDRYESLANRGTFKIHGGDYEGGVIDLRRAIEINPDAHFGREIVQIRLVEYMIAERAAGRGNLPLTSPVFHGASPHGFEEFRAALTPPLEQKETVTGLLGMLRFGHHDHPVLLDVLGEQLNVSGHKRLAARAYLKASLEVEEEALRQAYRERATEALEMQTPTPKQSKNLALTDLEKTFRAELADAEAYFGKICANERRWIAAGDDVDARYAEKYFPENPAKRPGKGSPVSSLLLFLSGLVVVAGVLRSA